MSADKDDEQVVYAQIDANLDTNPKIRKAGSFGRQVFEFVLRRNALRGSKGHVPVGFIDPDYLADQLMIAPADAVTGVTKAVTAKLIAIDDASGVVQIVGWHPSWGRRPKDGKDRTREWRERNKLKGQEPVTAGDDGDDEPSQVTTGDESDAIDQKRVDLPESHTRARSRHPDAGGIARRVWDYGAKTRTELAAANLHVPPWPIMHGTDHSGWTALLDRVCEQLVGSTASEAERVCRNRVDVAAAKARSEPNDAQWFSSTAMFTRNSFDHWSQLDPAQLKRKPPKSRAEGALIGSASPRNDHPVSATLIPINEL